MFDRIQMPTFDQENRNLLALFGAGRGRDELLLRMLSRGVAENRDVALLCEAFSRDSLHWREPALRILAARVADGVPLEVAAREVPRALPIEARWALGFGAETDTIPETLNLTAYVLGRGRTPALSDRRHQAVYLTTALWVMVSIVAFLMYYIIPKFKAIFNGFGIELPSLTVLLIQASDFFVNYHYTFVLAGMGLTYSLRRERTRFWGEGPFSFLSIWATRAARAAPNMLRLLAIAADKGIPWQTFLRALLDQPLPRWMRSSLLKVQKQLLEGHPLWTALSQAGWINPWEVTALEQSERVGNTAWTLRELANTRELRRDHRDTVRREVLRPATLLAVSVVVGFVVVALFYPMVKLINDLS